MVQNWDISENLTLVVRVTIEKKSEELCQVFQKFSGFWKTPLSDSTSNTQAHRSSSRSSARSSSRSSGRKNMKNLGNVVK